MFKYFSYLFLFFFTFQFCVGQTFVSKHFTTSDGLPSNEVKCIFKDSRGLVWFGTANGLSYFDGKDFKVFTTDDGLIGNNIWAIIEDKDHNLWISCYGKGLSKFNGNSFTNYTTSDGLVHNSIRTLFITDDNELLIGGQNGMSIFKNGVFKNFNRPARKKHNTPFQVMQFIKKKDNYFVMTYRHGFFKYNKKDTLYLDSITTPANSFQYMEYKNSYIYGTDYGLYTNNISPNFSNLSSLKNHLSDDVVWDHEHVDSSIYLASWGVSNPLGGVLEYDGTSIKNVNKSFKINSTKAWCLYYDKEFNKLWLGTIDNGVYVLSLDKAIAYNNPDYFKQDKLSVLDIKVIDKSKWILTKSKLIIENSSGEYAIHDTVFKNKYLDYHNVNRKSFQIIKKQFFVKELSFRAMGIFNDKIYINTTLGFFQMSKSGEIVSYYPTICDRFFIIDKNNNFLKPYNYSHFKIFPSIEQLETHKKFDKSAKTTPTNITDAVTNGYKSFFATKFKGLFIYENNKFTSCYQNQSFKELNIQHLLLLKNNLLYIAAGNGTIYLADVSNGFKIIKSIDKNKIRGNTITFINYYENHLLIGTNKGLNIYKDGVVKFLNNEQGYNNRNITCSTVYNDILYLGTNNSVVTLKLPELLSVKNTKSTISINDIVINHERHIKASKNWFNLSVNDLVLKYDENTIDIFLNTNELYNSKKIKLLYSIDSDNYVPITNNVIHLTNLSSDKYRLKIKIKDLLNGSSKITPLLNIKIKKPFWFTYWFWGLVIFITVGLFVLIYKYNVSNFKKREEIKSNLTKRIAETKLEALQSQMNPHFTFNAMSSIQNYVIDNDIDKALMYIGEFSRLMRKTLDNSSEAFISLADEIAYLNTYVSLENMRFDNLIDVSIQAKGINTADVFVPPMLIQPLIENSFNHAFNKENHSHLLIVNFSKYADFILCEVKDNGVGINKLTKTPAHTSKAMKIIKERLSLLSSLTVEELVTVQSSNKGTVIKILIPTG